MQEMVQDILWAKYQRDIKTEEWTTNYWKRAQWRHIQMWGSIKRIRFIIIRRKAFEIKDPVRDNTTYSDSLKEDIVAVSTIYDGLLYLTGCWLRKIWEGTRIKDEVSIERAIVRHKTSIDITIWDNSPHRYEIYWMTETIHSGGSNYLKISRPEARETRQNSLYQATTTNIKVH